MELEDLKEKLENEVGEYNELIDRLSAMEKERESRLARVQVLAELIEDKAKEPVKKEEKGVKTTKAEG